MKKSDFDGWDKDVTPITDLFKIPPERVVSPLSALIARMEKLGVPRPKIDLIEETMPLELNEDGFMLILSGIDINEDEPGLYLNPVDKKLYMYDINGPFEVEMTLRGYRPVYDGLGVA